MPIPENFVPIPGSERAPVSGTRAAARPLVDEEIEVTVMVRPRAAVPVNSVSVDKGKNSPTGDPNSADGEVMLDVEIVGAVAQGARIVVRFAPNTDRGFLDAISSALHDSRYQPSIISISGGAAESEWTGQALQNMNQVFQEAAALGVTVFCAAGDYGSNDGVVNHGEPNDSSAHVDFPASSPYVVACGGTHIEVVADAIGREVVWNDSTDVCTGLGSPHGKKLLEALRSG